MLIQCSFVHSFILHSFIHSFGNYLSSFLHLLINVLYSAAINVGPPKKQQHLSLAYQYPPEHHEELVSLAKQINLSATCRWDLRLYSRDPRMRTCEVRRITIIRFDIGHPLQCRLFFKKIFRRLLTYFSKIIIKVIYYYY